MIGSLLQSRSVLRVAGRHLSTRKRLMPAEVTEMGCVSPDAPSILQARAVLLSEGVLALPTDTVYGIACLAQSGVAVRRMYSIKKRDPLNALAICVGNVENVYKWAKVTIPVELLSRLLPGAVTLIFQRTPQLNPELNPGKETVAVRIPDSPFVRTLAQSVDAPLALTSANISSEVSTLRVDEFSTLWSSLDLVVDGGAIGLHHLRGEGEENEQRKGSTIVDLSEVGAFRIHRAGCRLKATKDLLLSQGLREHSG